MGVIIKMPQFYEDRDEEPTLGQRAAAAAFERAVEGCLIIIGLGAGSGKSWFLSRAKRYIDRVEALPWV